MLPTCVFFMVFPRKKLVHRIDQVALMNSFPLFKGCNSSPGITKPMILLQFRWDHIFLPSKNSKTINETQGSWLRF